MSNTTTPEGAQKKLEKALSLITGAHDTLSRTTDPDNPICMDLVKAAFIIQDVNRASLSAPQPVGEERKGPDLEAIEKRIDALLAEPDAADKFWAWVKERYPNEPAAPANSADEKGKMLPLRLINDRNWPEDFDHENGMYECKCISCGFEFVGHKRRVVCKVCAANSAAGGEERTIGQILSVALTHKGATSDEVANKVCVAVESIVELLNDELYTNSFPIIKFREVLDFIGLSFDDVESSFLPTFKYLQSKETAESIRKKPAHYQLWENEESVIKYRERLRELMQPAPPPLTAQQVGRKQNNHSNR